MNTKPLAFGTTTPFETAVQEMVQMNHSCIIVTENKKPLGIITERDITRAYSLMTEQGAYVRQSLLDVMTLNPICINDWLSFSDALTLSRSRGIRHFPVINDEGDLIGIVSQTNLLNAYAAALSEQYRLENSIEELKLLSLEDPLMKVGNRRAMEVDLDYTEAEAIRHKKTYSIALFDVDFFKKFNDTYGHQAGDDALKDIANVIKKTIRLSDRVFRYGGEEILVLMPESNENDASTCAERVRAAIEGLCIPHSGSPFGHVTISGGVTSKIQGEWRLMVEMADKALYRAKNSGRNQVSEAPLTA